MILAALADRAHIVMAGIGRGQQVRDFLRRILQVRVQGDDDIAQRRLESGHDGRVLPEIAAEQDDPGVLRPLLVLRPQQRHGVVLAAIVHEDAFPAAGQRIEGRVQPGKQQRQVRLLVVHRDDNADVRVSRYA